MKRSITILFMVSWLLFAGPVRGQNDAGTPGAAGTEQGPTSPDEKPSGSGGNEAVESMTITFKNGTKGEESVRGISTGIVVDQQYLQQRGDSDRRGSLREILEKHGRRFSVGEDNTATVDLSSLSITQPVIFVMYRGGIYTKRLQGKKKLNVTMTVYESTRDRSVLRMLGHHIPIQRRRDRLVVHEIIMLRNTGDRTYVGPDQSRSFSISLPDGASDVRVSDRPGQEGGNRRSTDQQGRLWFSSTISPGKTIRKQLMYELPVRGNSVEFKRNIGYRTDSFFIAIPEKDVREVSSNLNVQRRASSPSGRGKVAKITAENVEQGRTVSVTFDLKEGTAGGTAAAAGTGSAAGPGNSMNTFLLIGIGVLAGLAMVVSLSTLVYVYSTLNTRGGPEPEPAGGAEASGLREMLLEEIARLDRDLEEGEISEEYHSKHRSRLKSRLIDLEGAES